MSVMNSRRLMAARSFDHLVGAQEQAGRDFYSAPPCGLEVDDKLELGRQYDWQVAGVFALKDACGINARLAIGFLDRAAVAHHAPSLRRLALRNAVDEPMALRQGDELLPLLVEERTGPDVNRDGVSTGHLGES